MFCIDLFCFPRLAAGARRGVLAWAVVGGAE
eukprot:CAMPEP_0119077972 /NCGR_PEP_ID=MMETSP1178-20130426/97525_1 /TAXON_ID=33656 /ORGANISM="unid sp, Strain CCMP2000" /LENGTH=30 /DNA_ID= /DNA_START= /DNA_END= /DNA_ORIENTATION=